MVATQLFRILPIIAGLLTVTSDPTAMVELTGMVTDTGAAMATANTTAAQVTVVTGVATEIATAGTEVTMATTEAATTATTTTPGVAIIESRAHKIRVAKARPNFVNVIRWRVAYYDRKKKQVF